MKPPLHMIIVFKGSLRQIGEGSAQRSMLPSAVVIRYMEDQPYVLWVSPLIMAWSGLIQNNQVRKVRRDLNMSFQIVDGRENSSGKCFNKTKKGKPPAYFLFPLGKKDKGSKNSFCWKAAGNFFKLPFSLNFTLEYLGLARPRQCRDAWKWKNNED